jgi:outer membrane protein assembly factor BamB
VLVGTAEGDVIAYALDGGAVLWRYACGAPLETAATLISLGGGHDGRQSILVGTRDGTLHALDVLKGTLLWSAELDGEMRAAPRMAEGLLLVTTSSNKVLAFEPDTGQMVWAHGRPAPTGLTIEGHARAAVAGDRVIATFSDGFAAAYRLKDGEMLWSRPLALTGGSFVDADADPVVEGNRVYVAAYTDGVYALDTIDGRAVWNQPARAVSTLARVGELLVAGSADGVLWGMQPETGRIHWQTQLGATPISRLVPDGDTVACTAGTMGLVVLQAHDGRPRQATPVGERAANDMSCAGDYLAFVSGHGNLYVWQRTRVDGHRVHLEVLAR